MIDLQKGNFSTITDTWSGLQLWIPIPDLEFGLQAPYPDYKSRLQVWTPALVIKSLDTQFRASSLDPRFQVLIPGPDFRSRLQVWTGD